MAEKKVTTLANGCTRFQKTVIVNGMQVKVWVEKEPQERQDRRNRTVECDNLRRDGYAGIPGHHRKNSGFARVRDKQLAASHKPK